MNNPIILNGVQLATVTKNEAIYIAIKPICEALKLDYKTQFDKIKEDVILSQQWGEYPTVAADKKERQMLCLPLEYIFGWIFSIGGNANETFLKIQTRMLSCAVQCLCRSSDVYPEEGATKKRTTVENRNGECGTKNPKGTIQRC